MSETKKVVKKEVVKATEVKAEVKAAEVKPEVKAVEVKAEVKPAKEVKAEVKPAKEVKEVKAEAKKETAKKAPAKKAAAPKKEAVKGTEVFVQYYDKEVVVADIEAKVKAAWVNETGKKESAIKSVKIYVKPEENAAYYVINENNLGRVEL